MGVPRWVAALIVAAVVATAAGTTAPAGAGTEDSCDFLPIGTEGAQLAARPGNPSRGERCLAILAVGSAEYDILIERFDDRPTFRGLGFRLPGPLAVAFDVPALGTERQAWRELTPVTGPDPDEIVIQFTSGCHAAEVFADASLSGDQTAAVLLARAIDRLAADGTCGGASTTTTTSGPSSGSTTTTTTALPSDHKALCAEAQVLLEGYTRAQLERAGIFDPLRTTILLDDTFLIADVQKAIRDYNGIAPDARAFGKDSLEATSNILWVAGGTAALPGPIERSFLTGQERNLHDTLVQVTRTRRGRGDTRRLTPGDVYALAVELHGGDATEAMLTAHNLMRAAAGDPNVPVSGVEELFDDELALLRDERSAAALAAFFGGAYLEMAVQSSWGAAAFELFTTLFSSEPALIADGVSDAVGEQIKEKLEDSVKERPGDTAGTSFTTRVYHGIERIMEGVRATSSDPEAYCFSLWGAQAGKSLYDSLPGRGTRGFTDPPFSDLEIPEEGPPPGVVLERDETRYVNVMQSPFSLQWSGPDGGLLLDQGPTLDDAVITGRVGTPFLPVADDTTWGAAWFGIESPDTTITFAAVQPDAVLHFTRTDLATGEAVYFEATAPNVGDRFVLTTPAGDSRPELMGPDGDAVEPRVLQLELFGSSAPAASVDDDDGGASTLPFVIGGLAVAALAAGAVLLVRRRGGSAPSTID